jgi:hypothetical protein
MKNTVKEFESKEFLRGLEKKLSKMLEEAHNVACELLAADNVRQSVLNEVALSHHYNIVKFREHPEFQRCLESITIRPPVEEVSNRAIEYCQELNIPFEIYTDDDDEIPEGCLLN